MNCAAKGMEMITSPSECKQAAESLNLLDTTIKKENDPVNGLPHGCIKSGKPEGHPIYSSPKGHPYSNVACGTSYRVPKRCVWVHNSYTGGFQSCVPASIALNYDCICKITGNLQST